MKRIFNGLFYILKFLLLVGSFGLTLFILIRMNVRLDKDMISILSQLIPFLLLFVVFIINMIFKQIGVTKNLFYNLTCCLVFAIIIFFGYRAIFYTNMVLNQKYMYFI